MNYPIRNYVRIDATTQEALDEVARYTFSKKSTLIRRYVQECVTRDIERLAAHIEHTDRLLTFLRSR